MAFNSLNFLVFFSVFFILYWFVFNKNLNRQNFLLLAASYFFYAFCDARFLLLLAASSFLNYFLGIQISKSETQRKKNFFLFIGLLQGLGGLFLFKYYNFFISSVYKAFEHFNSHPGLHTLSLVMPLGISFYTFRTISYLLEVEKNKIEPCKNPITFLSFVAFFPALISGPIDKARTLIPQLEKPRSFDYYKAVDGLRQILWGLFKKTVIADNCATLTNEVFNSYQDFPGSTLLIAAFFYTIQIYADFSGYSDMAIGIARLMGFNITRNFDYPFFSQNIAEFWRRWHISLTNWLTEYVFTPLSIKFRDYGTLGLILAIVINFTLVGIWHGANFTYILFGFLHGCYFIPLIISGKMNKRKTIAKNKVFPSLPEIGNVLLTFIIVMFTFVIFRSPTIVDAASYLIKIFSPGIFSTPAISSRVLVFELTLFTLIMFTVEWFQRSKQHALEFNIQTENQTTEIRISKPFRWLMYIALIYSVICFTGGSQDFMYFQF